MAVNLSDLEAQYGLPPGLLSLVQNQEDASGDPNAVSKAGAVGPFQFMPDTAKSYGVDDPTNFDQAATSAAKMLGDLTKQYKGDIPSVLAAYNWGSGNLDKGGMENAPQETKNYVQNIMGKIGKAVMPSAEAADAASAPQSQDAVKDPSKMTDEELLTEADRLGVLDQQAKPEGYYDGAQHITVHPQGADTEVKDPDKMTDEELQAEAKRLGVEFPEKDDRTYDYKDNSYVENAAHDLGPEFKRALVGSLDLAGEGAKQFARGATGGIDSDEGVLHRMADMPVGFGKAALGAMGAAFSPVDAAARSFAGNPLERKTGVPSGLTSFLLELAGPLGIEKGIEAGGSMLSKLAGSGEKAASTSSSPLADLHDMIEKMATKQDVDTTPLDLAKAAHEVGGETEVGPQSPTNEPIPMSAGQKTQDPALQRFEADAQAGALGNKAQSAANDFRTLQNEALTEHVQGLGDIKPSGNPADNIGTATKFIRANEAKADAEVGTAYDRARELSKGITIPPMDAATTLVPRLSEIKGEFSIDPAVTPGAAKKYDDLMKLIGGKTDKDAVPLQLPIALRDGELWRRATTNLAAKSTNPADSAAMREMVGAYDDYMAGLAGRVESPNADAIKAFRDAVSARRDYGRSFEGNPMVEKLLSGDKSVDDITKEFMASGGVGGKQGMLDNFNALMRASGQSAPMVRREIQNAFAQKVFDRSVSGKLPNSDTDAISPAKLKTELENLFVNQRQFAHALYGTGATANAEQAIKELEMISSKQANVGNPSSSGYALDRLNKMANVSGLVAHIPGMKWLGNMANWARENSHAKDAATMFTGTTPKRFLPKTPEPASRLDLGIGAASSEIRDQSKQQ